jgi:hypothetical protein
MEQPNKPRAELWMDFALIAFLIGFDVTARVLPHDAGVWPVAASAIFAGRMLRHPLFAIVVPLAAVALSNFALPPDDWRVSLVVYAAVALPAVIGVLARRWRGALPVIAGTIANSLIFFAVTNFAVWAFNDLYPMTLAGLAQCYAAAVPFLDRTVLGDLFWVTVLFGGAWLVQHGPALMRRSS